MADDTTTTAPITGDQVPRYATGAVQAEVDGELILLSPKDFAYFGATGSGSPVWDLIDGERTVDAIVADLETRFEAEPGVVRKDTCDFIEALVAAGLVEV